MSSNPSCTELGSAQIFSVYKLGRWWRPTERAARHMVWADFGWTHTGKCKEQATYRKAKIGYWVTLNQYHLEQHPTGPARRKDTA